MSDMEEISYWVHTKRAPCLYNYDNLIKRQLANAPKPASAPSDVQEVTTPKKKPKRKLSLLGDSASPEKQQNVYFETSQHNQRTVLTRSDSESDINFNIKNSSIKPKRIKLQRNRTTVHKKNKVVTSTPKTETTLRRSLRRAQRLNNNVQMHSSFDAFNSTLDKSTNNISKKTPQKYKKVKNNIERKAEGDHNTKISIGLEKIQKNGVINRQFEELSDVSGFTANYIRSTKVQVTNTSRILRSKGSKATRDTPHLDKGDADAAMICVNKSVNTTKPAKPDALNNSTDSSQNVINFITTKNNDKDSKLNKSTSQLKFVDTRPKAKDVDGTTTNEEKNTTFDSQCGQGRYPRRNKIVSTVTDTDTPTTDCKGTQRGKNKSRTSDVNDRKENPDESCVSRTRSGRSIGLAVRRPDNSVLVYNNSTEQISSGLTVNVAVADCSSTRRQRKSHVSSLGHRTQRSTAQSNSNLALRHDTTRERSGFAACFSDSDQETEPVKQRKFFT